MIIRIYLKTSANSYSGLSVNEAVKTTIGNVWYLTPCEYLTKKYG